MSWHWRLRRRRRSKTSCLPMRRPLPHRRACRQHQRTAQHGPMRYKRALWQARRRRRVPRLRRSPRHPQPAPPPRRRRPRKRAIAARAICSTFRPMPATLRRRRCRCRRRGRGALRRSRCRGRGRPSKAPLRPPRNPRCSTYLSAGSRERPARLDRRPAPAWQPPRPAVSKSATRSWRLRAPKRSRRFCRAWRSIGAQGSGHLEWPPNCNSGRAPLVCEDRAPGPRASGCLTAFGRAPP